SAGRIPNGATVERALPSVLDGGGDITLNLHRNDFTTVSRMVDAINAYFGPGVARAVDGVTVSVAAPADTGSRIGFLSQVENLELSPGSAAAKVIVNARTGTVVIGSQVRVMPAAVVNGSVTVIIIEGVKVRQPGAVAGGGNGAAQTSTVSGTQEGSRMFRFEGGTTLDEIARAVNEVGAAPGELIAIRE